MFHDTLVSFAERRVISMMTSAFFSGEILSKELMENVGTIFNIVLSSANKGEKYEVGVWLDKILPSSKK